MADRELQRHRSSHRARTVWLTYWATLFLLTHIPLPPSVGLKIPQGDKILHFVAYFILAWLGARRWCLTDKRTRRLRTLILWALLYALYGLADECLQPFVGRHRSMGDWLADIGGIVVATLWTLAWASRARLSEPDQG